MTTTSGRSSDTRRTGRSVGQWLLGLLIVLALAASILMIFTDNLSITGSLAVIAALWAAVIGAILVTRFRKQAETAEAKSRDLRLVYELQLEREIAARRQYELDVESTIRREVAAESGAELAALKEQVVSLRSSLERLLGESLPDDQVALPNEKLRELASGLGGHGLDPHPYGGQYDSPEAYAHDDGVLAARDFAQTAPSAADGRHIGPTADPNEMTEVIPVITDDPLSRPYVAEAPYESVYETEYASVLAETDEVTDVETADAADAEIADVVDDGGVAGGPGVGEAPSADEEPPAAAPVSAYVDETPTDEWATQAAQAEPTAPAQPTGGPVPFLGGGRHETVGAAAGFTGGRRRRREDEPEQPVAAEAAADDFDNAHSNGLPVSELLRQLRETEGGSGRRRRRD
ncbi:DUF6779 domain-containing protein [Gordonia sp. VNK1]|uniref:DUF6779 domain-containing protein n=1 Tax=Gordonia oleivorans TaxID=3156618 RepID=UPI0032B57EA2